MPQFNIHSPNPAFVPSLSEIGDLSCITPLPGFLTLKFNSKLKYSCLHYVNIIANCLPRYGRYLCSSQRIFSTALKVDTQRRSHSVSFKQQSCFLANITIDQFRYIKIQLNTKDLSTMLLGLNPTNSVVIPQSLVLTQETSTQGSGE